MKLRRTTAERWSSGSAVFPSEPMSIAPHAPTEIPAAAIGRGMAPRERAEYVTDTTTMGVPMGQTTANELALAIVAAWDRNEYEGGSDNPGQLAAVAARTALDTFTFVDDALPLRVSEAEPMRWTPPDTERALQLAVDLGVARQDNGATVLELARSFLGFMRNGTVEETIEAK